MFAQQQAKMLKCVFANCIYMHNRMLNLLVNLSSKNDTDLNGTTDYETFLAKLTKGCDTDPYSYINLNYTPDSTAICSSIVRIWNDLTSKISNN